MLIDRRNFWKLHGSWFIGSTLVAVLAVAWCIFWSITSGRWPGGGSVPGLVLGGLAAGIFLFEMALVAKKTSLFRTARWTLSAQAWMKAHIWLGLLCVPLVLLHSGGRLGGTLTTLLVAAFAVVVASGLWGLAVQNILPKALLEGAAAETIYSQIDAVGQQYAGEARRLVLAHCGGGDEAILAGTKALTLALSQTEREDGGPSGHVRGASRPVGPPVKRSPHPERELSEPIASPAVEEALDHAIEPFLAKGVSPRGLLGSRQRNQWYFDDLRLRVAPELRGLITQLETLCERRRQLNLQQRLHFWLHNWLWLHLPLSVALMALLVGHVIFALRFG